MNSRRAVRPADDDDGLVRFVRRYARTPLGPFLALPGNQVLELVGGRAVVGYRKIGRVLMTVGEPVMEPGLEEAALTELIEHCGRNRWRPVLESERSEPARVGEPRSLRSLPGSARAR